MAMQQLLVTVVVALCVAHAAWALMPRAARRGCARVLLRLPLPARLALPLERARDASTACGCAGCDHARPTAARGQAKTITLHRRPSR